MKRSASRPTNHIQHGLIKPTTCLYQTITPNKCRLISKICQCNLINIVTSMLQIIVVAFPYATQLQSIGPHCIFIYLLVTLQKDSLRFSVGSPALYWQFPAYSMYLWISQGQTSATVSQIQPLMEQKFHQFQVRQGASKKKIPTLYQNFRRHPCKLTNKNNTK